MAFLSRFLTRRTARIEAGAGVDSADQHVIRALGPRPSFDAARLREHGFLAKALTNRAERDEVSEDIHRKRGDLTKYYPTSVLTTGIVALFAVDLAGAMLSIQAFGLAGFQRAGLAAGLAASCFFLTYLVARHDVATNSAVRRFAGRAFAMLAYALVLVAVAWVRLQAIDEDVSLAGLLSEQIVLTVSTAGPALIAHRLLTQLLPARALSKDVYVLERRLRVMEKTHDKAQARVVAIEREGRDWDAAAARLRAEYAAEHRLEVARRTQEKQSA